MGITSETKIDMSRFPNQNDLNLLEDDILNNHKKAKGDIHPVIPDFSKCRRTGVATKCTDP